MLFFDSHGITEEEEKKAHCMGLSDEAVERISEGTAPPLFNWDIDLKPMVTDFVVNLDELERKANHKRNEKKETVWRFM